MRYLGLDIGSTSIKGAVLDPVAGTVSQIAKEPFPEPLSGLPPGWFEIDSQAVLTGVRRVIDRLLAVAPDCEGIVSCGQMAGVILVDAERRPLTNYLSWRDQRSTIAASRQTEPFYSRLLQQTSREDLLAIGRELKPGSMTTLLAWLREQDQLSHDAVPLMLGDFVMSHLTESPPVMDFTAATGPLDLRTRTWHRGLSAQLGIDGLQWPMLQSWRLPVGELRVPGRTIPVYPCVGDHQCALTGVGLAAGELSINISTGSQVALLTDAFSPGDYQTRCFLDERYLNTITHIPAGRSLNVLVDLLTGLAAAEGVALSKPWERIVAAAESAVDGELEIDLSFFAGPLGDHGAIRGITTENLTAGTLFRAAFRTMADNYSVLARRLSPTDDWSSVVLSGGLAQSVGLLRRFLSERIPGPQRLCESTEDTLLGLLAMSRVAAEINNEIG